MSISKYRALIKTVEFSSLTKAAEYLGYSQSGISHMINNLESEYGFLLLVRNKSGVHLTSKGEKVYNYMLEIVNQHEKLAQTVSVINGLYSGVINIGSFSSVATHWLPTIIKKFEELYPDVKINIKDGIYDEIENWISVGKVDCGFITLPTQKNLKSFPLIKDRLLVVLPKNHPLCNLEFFPLNALKKESFIMPGEGSHYDIGRIFAKSVQPKIRFSFRDDYSALAMVEKGFGITILPELALRDNVKNVHIMELESHDYRNIGLAYLQNNTTPVIKHFFSFIKNKLESNKYPFIDN